MGVQSLLPFSGCHVGHGVRVSPLCSFLAVFVTPPPQVCRSGVAPCGCLAKFGPEPKFSTVLSIFGFSKRPNFIPHFFFAFFWSSNFAEVVLPLMLGCLFLEVPSFLVNFFYILELIKQQLKKPQNIKPQPPKQQNREHLNPKNLNTQTPKHQNTNNTLNTPNTQNTRSPKHINSKHINPKHLNTYTRKP